MSESAGILKPGEIIKPRISVDEVPELVKRLFGIEALSVKALNSYDDMNFLIKVDPNSSTIGTNIPKLHSSGYTLKVMNSLDSQELCIAEGQNSMMLYLSSKGYNCPVPQKTLQGEYYHMYQSEDDNENEKKSHIVRLLSFVSHEILCKVPLTSDLCYSAGQFIAGIDRDLKDFSHAGIAARNFTWMMVNVPRMRQYMHVVTDPKKKALIEAALVNWSGAVEPVIKQLPAGYIHGDFNEQNILVSPTDDTKTDQHPTYVVSGVIDFGDVSVSCYVFELSVLTMGFMTMINDSELAGHAIAGYNAVRPLTQLEWDVIWECVCGRLVMSLVMGAYSYSLDPSNSYLLTTAATGWAALTSLLEAGKDKTVALWRQVVKTRVESATTPSNNEN